LYSRPDLKVIITSATIDADRFARHFARGDKNAPVIEVSGRLYKVEVRYRPVDRDPVAVAGPADGKPMPKAQAAREKRDLMDAVVDGVDEVCRIGSGDVLVFLPGEREIRDCAEALRKHHPPHVEILPLFARLSVEEQDRVLRSRRRTSAPAAAAAWPTASACACTTSRISSSGRNSRSRRSCAPRWRPSSCA
jgi:ATP-dependent helicase HrpA